MSNQPSLPNMAIILAAGFGMRMRPITDTIPKPLICVADKPLIQFNLDALANYGVSDVVVNIHYLAEDMIKFLQTIKNPKIHISHEVEKLLDSGGGIKNALSRLSSAPFFVLNADSFWVDGAQSNLARLANAWDESRMDFLLMLASGTQVTGYNGNGDFIMDANGNLKRRPEKTVSPFVYSGVGIINPNIFKDTPDGPFSLNLLFDRAIEAGRLYGLRLDGDWYHVGTPDSIFEAEQKLVLNIPGSHNAH
jgi:MurNAc alpha-1-phosphate uridylyltransferase